MSSHLILSKKPTILSKYQRRIQESRWGSSPTYTYNIASQVPYLDTPLVKISLKGYVHLEKSWASDRKLLTRAPEKRILHQNSLKINIFQNIKEIIYSFLRHFQHLRDAVTKVMVNWRHTRKSNAVRRFWRLGPCWARWWMQEFSGRILSQNNGFLQCKKNKLIYCWLRNIVCWKHKLWFGMKLGDHTHQKCA